MNECRFFTADRICKFFNGRTWEKKNKLHKRWNCLTGHRHSRHILQMWQQIFDEEEINAIHFKMCYAVWWHLNLFDLNWDSVSLSIFEFSFAGAICKRQQRQFGSLVPHQVTRVYQSINQSQFIQINIYTNKWNKKWMLLNVDGNSFETVAYSQQSEKQIGNFVWWFYEIQWLHWNLCH